MAPMMREPDDRPGVGQRVTNDRRVRAAIWRRYTQDERAAFDQLPQSIRRRPLEHPYDAWTLNAPLLWRRYWQIHRTRAEPAGATARL